MQTQTSHQLNRAEACPVWIIDNHGFRELKKYKAILNVELNEVACVASKDYNVMQHEEVYNAIATALARLNINFEQRIRQQAHRLFVDISFPDVKLHVSEIGEEFFGGLRLVNSYDKTTGLHILPRLERLACKNGMVVKKFVEGYRITHTQKLVEDFGVVVEKMLNSMINNCEKLKAMVNDCIGDSIEWVAVDKILNNLIGRQRHIKAIFGQLRMKEQITRWDIYNAITHYATHGEQLTPNIESWLQAKAQKLLETPLEEMIGIIEVN